MNNEQRANVLAQIQTEFGSIQGAIKAAALGILQETKEAADKIPQTAKEETQEVEKWSEHALLKDLDKLTGAEHMSEDAKNYVRTEVSKAELDWHHRQQHAIGMLTD